MTERPQNRHLESYTKLPDTHRATKAFRFTLPVELANRLESLTKEQRDALLERALRLD